MLRIGITGQVGFMGTHLFNYLKLKTEEFELIPFKDEYFDKQKDLKDWVCQCDVIVHLAAINRNNDLQVLYDTNINLVKQLMQAIDETRITRHVIFASSIQEDRDNQYGKSKKEGRQMLSNWAKTNGINFTGMVIPNTFGPFGRPYYNSVIATFCYQLSHNEVPKIDVDGQLRLIYVGELVDEIYKIIVARKNDENLKVQHTSEHKVSEILSILQRFKKEYYENSIIPALNNKFELNLFNTFRCYFDIKNYYPFKLVKNADNRGSFVETIKLEIGGQVSFSFTKPGITRGNHFHIRKIERFVVIKGEAHIQLRKIGTDEVLDFYLSGENPAYVDMPIWFTHNITNVGKEDLYTIFWINEFYNASDPDTYFENV